MSPFLGKGKMHPVSIVFWLYTVLQCRSNMSLNSLIFHTSGGISSSPAAFLFLIFLSTESRSSCVNCPSLMSYWSLIIYVIGSCVTFWSFPSKILKCFFPGCICSFQFSFCSALPPAHFVYRLPCHPRLSIFNQVSNLIDLIWYVICLLF